MARRLLNTSRSWRSLISPTESLNSSPRLLKPLNHRHDHWLKPETLNAYEGGGGSSGTSGGAQLFCMFPIVASGLLGIGVLDKAYADANEATGIPPSSPDIPTEHPDLEETARKERQRLENLLKSKGKPYGYLPRFKVAVKGQKITIKFQVPEGCEIPRLIANLSSNLGLKVEDRSAGAEMSMRAWESSIAWQITLTRPKEQKEIGENADKLSNEGDLLVLIFRSLISTDKPEIEFIKKGSFEASELDALASVLQLAGERVGQNKSLGLKSRDNSSGATSSNKSVTDLESMGVRVFGIDELQTGHKNGEISWETIAGYDHQKREIEDTILLALQSPEVYDDIARGTRRKFESNRPRAVLFEGPPGTGKTSSARVIANQAGVPLLYVPLEIVMSKYYGESERLLGKVFSLSNELPDGAIIFLDEVDSFAAARDTEMHEATRRILSVLLRQIDGFEQDKKVVVIAATNRKQDLDPALISRFDSIITFGLPDLYNRVKIASQYAKHLTDSELTEFASSTEGMSGRDIRDICQQAERRWASKCVCSHARWGQETGNCCLDTGQSWKCRLCSGAQTYKMGPFLMTSDKPTYYTISLVRIAIVYQYANYNF
ncbi:hypothetical protein V2J09_019392 [Rumex salicifolius]